MTLLTMLYVIFVIYANDTTLYSKCYQASDVCADAVSCYLKFLDSLQIWMDMQDFAPSLAASQRPLTNHQNVASLSLFL